MKHTTGHIFKRGRTFYLQWSVDGQRFKRSLRTGDKDKARQEAENILAPCRVADAAERAAMLAGRATALRSEADRLTDERTPPLAMADAWSAYLESETRPDSGEVTLRRYESHWGAFLRWVESQKKQPVLFRDVTPDHAERFVRHMNVEGLSGSTINRTVVFLKTMHRVLAKRARASGSNPWDSIAKRKHRPQSKRPLTIAELKTILENATGEMKLLFFIGTFTGLRLHDAATLRWSAVDVDRLVIRVTPHKTARTSGETVIVGIPTVLADLLKHTPRRGQFVMPGMAEAYQRDSAALSNRIQAHLESCGIQTVLEGTGFHTVTKSDGTTERVHTGKRAVVLAGFHSLRHTFVSLHAQAGSPLSVIQKLVGHGSPAMTEVYLSVSEDAALDAARRFPVLLGESAAALPEGASNREPVPPWIVEAVNNSRTIRDVRKALGIA